MRLEFKAQEFGKLLLLRDCVFPISEALARALNEGDVGGHGQVRDLLLLDQPGSALT